MKEHTIHHLCVARYKTGIQFSLYYFNCLRKKGETIMLKKFLTLLISAIMLICVNSIHVNAQEVVNKGIRTEAVTIRRIKAA